MTEEREKNLKNNLELIKGYLEFFPADCDVSEETEWIDEMLSKRLSEEDAREILEFLGSDWEEAGTKTLDKDGIWVVLMDIIVNKEQYDSKFTMLILESIDASYKMEKEKADNAKDEIKRLRKLLKQLIKMIQIASPELGDELDRKRLELFLEN